MQELGRQGTYLLDLCDKEYNCHDLFKTVIPTSFKNKAGCIVKNIHFHVSILTDLGISFIFLSDAPKSCFFMREEFFVMCILTKFIKVHKVHYHKHNFRVLTKCT